MTQIEFAYVHKIMHTWRVIDLQLLNPAFILTRVPRICP